MATLEVHDADGRVQRVRITRDDAFTFGSGPLCDVVLVGPEVAPFHGRIRWSKRRYKVDASPGVSALEVNGKKLVSSSLYQGDEIQFGGCRIFILSTAEDNTHGDKTVIQPAPTRSPGRSAPPPPAPPAPVAFHKMEMAPPSIDFDDESGLVPLDDDPPPPPQLSATAKPLPPPEPKRSSRRSRMGGRNFESVNKILAMDTRSGESPFQGSSARNAANKGRLRGWLGNWDRPPGEERVFSSPVVLGLVGALALLILFSVLLRGLIIRGAAQRLYTDAIAKMEDGDDRTAIRDFDRFLAENPKDPRIGKARVLRGLARVRQHTGAAGTSWGNALKEAVAMVGDVGQSADFADTRMDLAEQFRKIAEGLADRARDLADPNALQDSASAVTLHNRLAGTAAASLVARSRIPAKVAAAEAAIEKKQARARALAGMDSGLKERRADEVYNARTNLVRRYPDLAADRDITAKLIAANDLIRQAVRFDPERRSAQTEPRADPLGQPTSVVYRLDPGRAPASSGPIAYTLADGFAYGLDVATGAPLWQVAVGVASPFPPQAIAGGDAAALAFDARSNELIRLDGRTGRLVWRLELDGPVRVPPLVLGNRVLQTMPDGRLLPIDLATGEQRGVLHLGRPIASTPTADESARHLYLPAVEGCLYVISLDPLACVAVEFIGHEPGSIACAPALVGRFLVVPINQNLREGSWRVYVVDEAGTRLRFAQQVVVGGWTWATPEVSGPVIWSTSDRGELVAYAIGLYDAKTPFTPIARIPPESEAAGPSFVVPRGEREIWVASALSGRYELDPERGRLQAAWTLGVAGPALAPPRIFGRLAVLTQQDAQAPGASVWGVDAESGAVRWRTVLGAAWPIPLVESTSGDGLTALGVDGRPLVLSADRLRSGGFVEQPLPRAGSFRLPEATAEWIEVAGATVVVPSLHADHLLVRTESPEFVRVDLPAPLGAMPVAWGPSLLVPGRDGRAYLIDPRTGATAADPFIPPFDRTRPVRWLTPQPLDGDAMLLPDADGTLRRLVREASPRPRLVASAEIRLDHPPVGELASTGSAILVATRDGTVRSLASRDLSAQGRWPLAAPLSLGPVAVSGMAFVLDTANNVLAFAPDGHRLWSTRLEGPRVVGSPTLRDGMAWFLDQGGSARPVAVADGSTGSPTILDLLPAGGPIAAGDDLIVPAGVGTVRALNLPLRGAAKP